MFMPRALLSSLAASLLLCACGGEPAHVGSESGGDGDSDALGVDSMLAFLNGPDATVPMLVDTVRIQVRAANNIVAHVRGADGALGGGDDNLLNDEAELDAIAYVGPATIEAIKAYVRTHTQRVDLTVEGVDLSSQNAADMVALSNSATQQMLDDDVGLDSRAAHAIVVARPIADIQALSAVSYVGTTALTRLRDWVIAHPGTPVPPVDATPAVILSASVPDATHVLITFSKPIDPSTSGDAFDVFMGEPDAPLSAWLDGINGAVVTIGTDTQEPGVDYTFEAADTVKDVYGIAVDANNGRWIHFDGFSDGTPPPPPPGGLDCSTLVGGTFDGVAFNAAQECQAVQFINIARFSEMAALSEAGRRIAYDCAPSGACGFRTSQWTSLAQYSGFTGVGPTALGGLKTAIAGWSPTGLPYDTVANTWQNRATLVNKPVSFDSVFVERRLADQSSGGVPSACVKVRDADGAPNFLTVCLTWGSDSSGPCAINAGACMDNVVGAQVSLRGTLRASSASSGGYRVTLQEAGPGGANPALQ